MENQKTFFEEDEVVPSLIGDKVKMDETLSYDQEDALVRGQIPLYEFKEVLKAQDESKITTIDFSRNGYCNDAILKLIATEKKKPYVNLKTVNLVGCILVTNAGIKWLTDIVAGVKTLTEIRLDGCTNLSDDELSLLLKSIGAQCEVYMRGTSVTFMSSPEGRRVTVTGCPILSAVKKTEELKVGHAIVIPHESVEHSFVEFVKTKKPVKRLPFHHETDVEVNDWLMSFTEMSLEHPLLDCMINNNQTQILIPFGESAVIKEIKKHVTDTIARTITKTAFTTDYMKNSGEVEKNNPVIDIEVEDFLTIQNICKQHYTDEGVLGNYCYKDELLGCFVSRTTLTRSNYYFESELVNVKVISPDGTTVKVEDSEDDDDSENESESKSGILIGCLFNQLFSSINPLDVDVDKGGEVSTFDFTKCKKFGFGIKGEWLSEYIPSKTAKFFATCDGIENNKDLTGTSVPEEMLYPLIAVIGEKNNSGNVKISNLAKPPENLTRKYAKENRWITTGYSENILIDNYGVMCNSSPNEDEGMFISMEAITQEFSIKVLDKGNFGKIKIALSKEKEKDKEMQKSESWIYQGVTGEVISEKRPKYLEDPCRVETGDILTVKFDNKDGEKIVLYKNGKEIVETAFTPDKDDNRSIVKLYIFLSEMKGKVQLLNYRPKYRGPVLFPESLTVGRLHNMIVFDDGKIVTPIPKKKKDIFYGCYMGKFPMNSQRLSFEVEITEELNDELESVAMGFCHSEIPQIIGIAKQYKDPATHFEVSGGCVMFSSGGNVFAESVVQSSFREEGKYKKGDKIKCEVEKVSSAEKLLFEEDGSISPQQDVNIKFFVNDKLTHQYTMSMRSDGLFPTVFTNGNISKEVTLRVLNFYAETEENRKKANLEQNNKKKKKKSEKEEGQKKEKVPCPNFKDCEFIVVEVGKTEGKLQLIEEQLKGDKFQSTLETMAKSIEYYEKNFKDLDLLDQNKYASLCQAKEKIEGLVNNISRIQYMSLDLTTGKGMDKVLERVTDTMDCRKLHQEVKYNIPKKCQGHIQTIMKELKKEKVIEFGTGLTMFEEITLKMEGHEFLQIAKLLHEQGKLALLQLGSRTIVADIEYLQSVLDKLERMSDMEKCGTLSTAISEASHVWTSETVMSHFTAEAGKISVLMEILQDYFGLVEVPVWRHVPEDTQFLYTTLDNLSTAPIPLREFWGEGERTKNFIAMQKTFSFIHSISDHTLAAVLSSATKYGRTLLITPEGAVFQIGCVQTVIASHKGLLENSVLTIESKCYLPDMKVGPVDELTETYVREYTWNIFCLYTDMLEKVLKQKNIIYLQTGEAPTDLANLSVGCKHTWKHIPGKANQSICTMCNKCCDQGRKCKYNRIMGNNLRECLCKTSSPGCVDCGICIECAADLWSIRSYLRPMPITEKNSKVVKTEKVEVKPSDTTEDKNVQKKVTPEETNNVFLQIPLDPVTFNELEYQHISGGSLGVVLKEIDDGSCVSIFPGKATTLATDTDEQKMSIRNKILMKQATDAKYKSTVGESLKLRITDPFKLITTGEDKLEISGIQESRVVYHASICREMSVSHESGLLCYNSASHSVPVAQFIGPKPFSENLKKISLKIIDCGDKTNIGIGICPGKTYPVNRMPGWNRWSIAYHADDGGIFIEAGAANSHVVKCTKGDVMSMFCDVVSKQLVFYKNDQEVKQIKINIPRGGYWPMIGMHSVGECVKLLEKDPWTPDPDDIPPKPASFKTYKYGNLWISPARNVSLTKKGYTGNQCGWMLLHNPTKVLIGYKITPESLVKRPVGSISPNDANTLFLTKTSIIKEDAVTIQWIAIEQVKEYTTDQILQLFDAASSSSTYTHRLGLLVKDTALGDVETLPKFQDLGSTSGDGASPVKQDGYKLEVFKNCILVDSYLLKRGRYILDLVDLDNTKPDYIIKRPKCPSFLYPPKLQKGMKVVVKLDIDSSGDQFADAVISEIYDGGGYCFEYTSPGKVYTGNEKICVGTMDCGIEDADWEEIERKGNKEEMKIQLLSSPSNMSLLHRTYVPAPPHLVTKGSSGALEMIDPEWKKTALFSFSFCYQSITRPTVQEQTITKHSRKLLKWLTYRDSNLPLSVILLPSHLDGTTLKYPNAKTMFSDISVHRLCFFQDGYIDMKKMPMVFPSKIKKYPEVRSTYDDINIHAITINDGKEEKTYPLKQPREVCLHMMDLPGFTVNKPVPEDLSYACLYQAWTYVALLTHKLLLPSYTKIFTGELGSLERKQIESLLFQLIQPYASLCSLYSAQYGGLSNQENPTYLSEKIQDLCDDKKQPIPIELLGKGMIENNHTFVRFPPFLACKAHSHSRVDRNIVRIPDMSLESKFYEPYSEKMDILIVNGSPMKSLPSNLFNIFENLQVLTILNVDLIQTPEFPSGISRCNDLEIVCLSGLPGVKKMPKDILRAPALSTFYLHNCPIRKLDIEWPASTTLTSLSLKGLLIQEVPKEIAKLSELNELNLDCNPILTLPDELEHLKKLKHLSAKGIPWIAFEGKFDQMPKSIYETWHAENPYIINYLSEKEVEDLFDKFDDNNNNILDSTEVAKLNFEFLTTIPRIGIQKLGDSQYGGVPPVIFKLKGLESLDLSYTAINCIPDYASELFTLQTLNLEHCPFLESVSGNVGLLPNLRSLHLNSCAMLDSPPPDIVGRGFDSVRAFLKKMAGGFTECHRTKLMFIGLGQAGKTTLLQALKSPTKKTQGTQDAKLTDGIEIKPWVVPVQDMFDITYSCWDFAGQTVYYNTHQFFLSKQAVYMLLWNMRMGFEHAGLDFWLSSVACHCPNAPVVIVGTQLDQIPMPDIPEKELMKKYPQIKKFCYVSSTAGTNIAELEETLIDVTMTHCSQMKLKIPKVWLNFEESILVERKRGKNILEWGKLKQYAIDNGIFDDKDIRLAVQFLDDLGTVQYFDTEVLRDRVVINPQWIVDVMAKVVSVNEKYIKESKGRFFHKFISEIWKDYDTNLHEWMLKLTERFDLTFPLPKSGEAVNVVPCLLPEEEPEDLPWPKIEEEEGIRESKIQYKFTYLPTGLFNRAQARLFSQGFTDTKLLEFLWKKGSILKKNNHYALVKQISDYEMIVTVQGPRPKNILDLIHETISTLIKDSFTGVDYDFYIPCPDCVEKEMTKDPFLFRAELISRAHSVNAPFLQCTKYFHTVSIGELLSNMPDNRDTEFDVQIQESIGTLQEIRTNMAQDVVILYNPEDIPTKEKEGQMVDPRKIHEDLKEVGFNCWFSEDMENATELEIAVAIMNAKVVVVCMSERFTSYQKCRQMFLYALEQLNKPFAVAVMDESQEWQQTDVGFKIGNPRMAMIKSVKRYEKKMEDLIDIIKNHLLDIEKNTMSKPAIFISYCWANSHEACSVTTQAKEGSLGHGDPRAIKKHIEKAGLPCWLDIEQMGKFGIYQDITIGLQNSKVLVVCVSDEYLQSEACMMEARFGGYNLHLPLVVCVVGTGKDWKTSEIALMIQKLGEGATVIKMQRETPGCYDRVLEHVKTFLKRPETEKQKNMREKLAKVQQKQEKTMKEELEKTLKQQGDTKFSFQEEIELIQRKFMRHISKITRTDDLENELPKLMVFDFVKKAPVKRTTISERERDMQSQIDGERPSTAHSLRARTSKMSQSRDKMKAVTLEELEDDWQGEDFCIRVLCEDEQGWHVVGEPLSLINRTSEEIYKALKDAAPFLARIYAVLKQSAINLNCLSSKKGDNFLNYIRKEGIDTKNFSDAYKVIHKLVSESEDRDQFISPLNRCYLQSGKISWLCPDHQNKAGITQLQIGTASIHGTSRVLIFEEDKLLKDLSVAYRFLSLEKQGGKDGPSVQKEKSFVIKNSGLKKEKSNVEKKVEENNTKKSEERNEERQTPRKKKSDKTVKIADTSISIPSPSTSRPVSSTSSTATSSKSGTSTLSRRKSQRKTTSQACSIQ